MSARAPAPDGVERRLNALEAAVGELKQVVTAERTARTDNSRRVEQLQARISRIVEGDPEIGFRGLREEVGALATRQQTVESLFEGLRAEVREGFKAWDHQRALDRATLRGAGVTLRVVGLASGVNLAANLAQFLGLVS